VYIHYLYASCFLSCGVLQQQNYYYYYYDCLLLLLQCVSVAVAVTSPTCYH